MPSRMLSLQTGNQSVTARQDDTLCTEVDVVPEFSSDAVGITEISTDASEYTQTDRIDVEVTIVNDNPAGGAAEVDVEFTFDGSTFDTVEGVGVGGDSSTTVEGEVVAGSAGEDMEVCAILTSVTPVTGF